MDSRLPEFRAIQFGFASAEVESSEAPQLLLRAFFDTNGIVKEAIEGRKFLLLGPKGSGKSAIGLHLSLLAAGEPGLFVTRRSLGDFSFRSLGDLIDAESEDELRYLRAWRWLLLLSLTSSIVQDAGATHIDEQRFQNAVDALRGYGLLPLRELADAVGKSSIRDFKLSAWGVELAGSKATPGRTVSLSVAIDFLKDLIAGTTTSSKHVIVIDGLDDILLDSQSKLGAISALVLEASRLNQLFREAALPFKILVLCRTDVYERLPGSNQNKLRQDLAVELDWFEEAADPRNAALVRLANLRATLSNPRVTDVFTQYFPTRLGRSRAVEVLLEHTRHTPRDFIQLLKYVQHSSSGPTVDFREIRAALRAYSEKYFLPEIKDELEGMMTRNETESFLDALRQFHRTEFTCSEFRDSLGSGGPLRDVDIDHAMKVLYESSAVGNVYILADQRRRYSFRYRNPGSTYNKSERVVVHHGLRRALQLYSDGG